MSDGGARAWKTQETSTRVPTHIDNVRFALPFYVNLQELYPSHAKRFGDLSRFSERSQLWNQLFQMFLALGERLRDMEQEALRQGRHLDDSLVSFYMEAVLEDHDLRASKAQRDEYRGRVDDVVIGYRLWILVHDVSLEGQEVEAAAAAPAAPAPAVHSLLDRNAADEDDDDLFRDSEDDDDDDTPQAKRHAAGPIQSEAEEYHALYSEVPELDEFAKCVTAQDLVPLVAQLKEQESQCATAEELEEANKAFGVTVTKLYFQKHLAYVTDKAFGQKQQKQSKKTPKGEKEPPRKFRQHPNQIVADRIWANSERAKKQKSASKGGGGGAAQKDDRGGGEYTAADDIVSLEQWENLAALYAHGNVHVPDDHVRRLDDHENPFCAQAVFSVLNAFQPLVCGERVIPEQSHMQFHRYFGIASDSVDDFLRQRVFRFQFPLRAYAYRIRTSDFSVASVMSRQFPHLQRSGSDPIASALHVVEQDLRRQSQLAGVSDVHTGQLLFGKDTGSSSGGDDATTRRLDAMMQYTNSFFGFAKQDTEEEMQEKREAYNRLARFSRVPTQSESGRAQCQMQYQNVLQSAHRPASVTTNLSAESQMQTHLQNYTSAFGPILVESRRIHALLASLAATYYHAYEELRMHQEVAALEFQEEQRELFGVTAQQIEDAKRNVERLRTQYQHMFECREFLVVLRKMYRKNQDTVAQRYQETCWAPQSDISQVGQRMMQERQRHQLYDLRETPVQVRKVDAALNLYQNWELSFYMETGALFFLAVVHRELSLMFKAQKDAYRVDFGLHYNLLLVSAEGGAGKSMCLELTERLCVQGSVQYVSSQTTHANATEETNMNDMTEINDEVSMRMVGGNARNSDMDQEKNVKEMMTRNKTQRKRMRKDEDGKIRNYISYSECIGVHFWTTNANVYKLLTSAMLSRMHVITVDGSVGAEDPDGHTIASMNMMESLIKDDPQERKRLATLVRRSHVQQLMFYDVEKLIHLGALSMVTPDVGTVFMLELEMALKESNSHTFNAHGRNFQRTMILARINCILDAIHTVFFAENGKHYGKQVEPHMFLDLDPLLYIQLHHIVSALGECLDLYVDTSEDQVREALCYLVENQTVLEISDAGLDSNRLMFDTGRGVKPASHEANYLQLKMAGLGGYSRGGGGGGESGAEGHAAHMIHKASVQKHGRNRRRAIDTYKVENVLRRLKDQGQVECWPLFPTDPKVEPTKVLANQSLEECLADTFNRKSRLPMTKREAIVVLPNRLLVHPCYLYPGLLDRIGRKRTVQDTEPAVAPAAAVAAAADPFDMTDEDEQVFRDLMQQQQQQQQQPQPVAQRSNSNSSSKVVTGRDLIVQIIQDFCRRQFQLPRRLLFDVNHTHTWLRNVIDAGPTEQEMQEPEKLRPLAVFNVAYRTRATRALMQDSDQMDEVALDEDGQQVQTEEQRREFQAFLDSMRDSRLHLNANITIEVDCDIDEWGMRQRQRQLFITGHPIHPSYCDVSLERYLEEQEPVDTLPPPPQQQQQHDDALNLFGGRASQQPPPPQPMTLQERERRIREQGKHHVQEFLAQGGSGADFLAMAVARQPHDAAATTTSVSPVLPIHASDSRMFARSTSSGSMMMNEESRDIQELRRQHRGQASQRNQGARLLFLYLNQESVLQQRQGPSQAFFLGEQLELLNQRMMDHHRAAEPIRITEDQVRQLIREFDLTDYEHKQYTQLLECGQVVSPTDQLLPDADFDVADYVVMRVRGGGGGHSSSSKAAEEGEPDVAPEDLVPVYHWEMLPADHEAYLNPYRYKQIRHLPMVRDDLYNMSMGTRLPPPNTYPQEALAEVEAYKEKRRQQRERLSRRYAATQKQLQLVPQNAALKQRHQQRMERASRDYRRMHAFRASGNPQNLEATQARVQRVMQERMHAQKRPRS